MGYVGAYNYGAHRRLIMPVPVNNAELLVTVSAVRSIHDPEAVIGR